MTDTEQLDAVFAALASPVRRAILSRLIEGEAAVNVLAEPFGMSLPAVSKHIQVLERAGLITRSREGQFRPCQLNAAPLQAVAHWAELYRPVWEDRFEAMDQLLQAGTEERDD